MVTEPTSSDQFFKQLVQIAKRLLSALFDKTCKFILVTSMGSARLQRWLFGFLRTTFRFAYREASNQIRPHAIPLSGKLFVEYDNMSILISRLIVLRCDGARDKLFKRDGLQV